MITRALVLSAALAFASAASALEPEEAPACMAPVPITAALVRDAGAYDWIGYAGAGALPPFLIGSLSPTRDSPDAQDLFGDVVFVQSADGWRAYQPRQGEGAIAVFTAPESGGVIIATMWQSEGPGQHWTLARSADGFATSACATLDFPDTLNQPSWANEFLSLYDLDVAASGHGAAIGAADVERDGRARKLWFRYTTQDGGATWSAPRRLMNRRSPPAGVFTRLSDSDPPAHLTQSLEAFAAAR